ncbi:hypothetical protein V8G54_000330 [Vigna mungo]|uniref:Uncharacterized protein n=1 Tax=Vigna mungo TaxID=3915 RepID=A0AAQ3P6C5_VIGMU
MWDTEQHKRLVHFWWTMMAMASNLITSHGKENPTCYSWNLLLELAFHTHTSGDYDQLGVDLTEIEAILEEEVKSHEDGAQKGKPEAQATGTRNNEATNHRWLPGRWTRHPGHGRSKPRHPKMTPKCLGELLVTLERDFTWIGP